MTVVMNYWSLVLVPRPPLKEPLLRGEAAAPFRSKVEFQKDSGHFFFFFFSFLIFLGLVSILMFSPLVPSSLQRQLPPVAGSSIAPRRGVNFSMERCGWLVERLKAFSALFFPFETSRRWRGEPESKPRPSPPLSPPARVSGGCWTRWTRTIKRR